MTSQYYGGRISGGAVGGFQSLEKYHEGTLSHEKALLIRNIAADLQGILKFPANIASEPIERIISILKTKVPDPRTHTISSKSDMQSHICQAMAHAINHRYGRTIIDTTASPKEVCEHTAEIMNTLFSNIKSEFLSAATDIKRSLGNLALLRRSIASSFDKLYSTVQRGTDDSAKLQSYGIKQLYDDLIVEIDRQMAILANIIGTTIDPATTTIADLTETDRDFRGFVRSLKSELGTPDLSRKLTYMLSGVSNVGTLAETIDRALKKIGHSVTEYTKYRDTPRLIEHLHEAFERQGHHPNSDELAKFVAAIQLIKDNDYQHEDIISYLGQRAKKVAAHPKHALRKVSGKQKKKHKKVRGRGPAGGAEGENSLEKRLDRQRRSRELLFRDFEQRLEQQYKQIFSAVEVLSRRLGNGVPMDDHLQRFVRCMEDLDANGGVDRQKFYLALSGYQTDPASKEERQRFLGQLEAVSKSLKPLISGPSGEHFQTIKSAVDRLIETIDTFKETYLKAITSIQIKPTGGDPSTDDPSTDDDEIEVEGGHQSSSSSSSSSDDEIEGGARKHKHAKRPDNVTVEEAVEEAAVAAVETAETAIETAIEDTTTGAGDLENTSFVTLGQAIKHLLFFYNVAKVKHNLAIASKDIKGYAKDYDVVLGDAIGNMVIKVKREYEVQKKDYDVDVTSTSVLPEEAHTAKLIKAWITEPTKHDTKASRNAIMVPSAAKGSILEKQRNLENSALKAYRQSVKDSAMKYYKETMNVKVDLYKTVEAIDIYLANFAEAVASNPNDIKELNQLLKSVDIVAKWFTDKSGNTIADFFESTPSALIDTEEICKEPGYTNSNDHYYKWVAGLVRPDVDAAAKKAAMRLPGNPFIGVLPGRLNEEEDLVYDQIIEKAKKSALAVRVLDNIISTFAKLGSQYGNVNLNSKTFMPPGVIFKNLRKYMYHSSIVMGMDEHYSKPYPPGMTAQTNIPGYAIGKTDTQCDADKEKISHVVGNAIRTGAIGVTEAGETGGGAPGAPTSKDTKSVLERSFAADGKCNDQASSSIVERWVRKKFCMAFSSIYDSTGKPLSGFASTWFETDQLFLMCIKSMVAKVFTVIGTYGVFNKPLDRYKGLTSTRLILGGDYAANPEIIPAAIELYVRLPLLAEFYREVFDFDDTNKMNIADDSTNNKKITLVPEFDGVWENFVKIVFEDAKYVVEGTYSELHVKALIREINEIYNKYKSPGDKSTVQDVISAFVAEINRRYGVVKKSEIDLYLKSKRRYDAVEEKFTPEERLEYNILDERDQTGRGPAPSDRFDHLMPSEERKIDNPFARQYITLVRNFRQSLDSSLKRLMPTSGKPPKVSFDQSIRSYKEQVESAKTPDEKYKIILKSMQGIDQLSSVNSQKALMFHELVVAPLGTLYSIWTILDKFISKVQSMDVIDIEETINNSLTYTGLNIGGLLYNTLRDALDTKKKGYARYLKCGDKPSVAIAPLGVPAAGADRTNIPSGVTVGVGAGVGDNNILVHRGTYGACQNLTWKDVQNIADATIVGEQNHKYEVSSREGIKRFTVDREMIFKDMINLCFSLGADLGDMASVKVQQGNILIEYGQLAEYCGTLLDSVKKNLELFRGVIDTKVINRVEGGGGTQDAASIYFLDENLMERIFKDSRQGGKHSKQYNEIGIIKTNELLSRTFKRLAGEWTVTAQISNVDGLHFTGPTGAETPESELKSMDKLLLQHEKTLLRDSYERPMSELLYWKAAPEPIVAANGLFAAPAANEEGSKRGAIRVQFKHPMRQPAVMNNSINDWPFAVIPAMERTGAEDDDIKSLKALQDAMLALQTEIKHTIQADLAVAGANATDGIFRYPADNAYVPAGTLGTHNFGVEADFGNFNAVWGASHPAVGGGVPVASESVKSRVKDLCGRYNALYKQRERTFQSSIHTPLDHRTKWYTDPSGKKEGAWFLGQLKPTPNVPGGESREKVAPLDISCQQFDAGLLVRLNEILSKYLYNGWDTTTKKMYSGLINKFANGTHVAATNKGHALNDIVDPFFSLELNGTSSGIIGVPAQHTVVFASLARAMRNILVNSRKSGDPEFRTDTMMEVPIHMKETLRANLPHFEKLFKLVIKKAELLRQVSQQVSLVRQLPYALKYGIDRYTTHQVPNLVFPRLATAVAGPFLDWPSSYTLVSAAAAVAGNAQNAEYLMATPNTALLEPDDILHTASGFVIRSASSKAIADVDAILVGMGLNRNMPGAIAPPAPAPAWIRGMDATTKGARYSHYCMTICNPQDDTNATAYSGFHPYVELPLDASKRWHTELIDDVANMAISLSKCCMDTYKELADEPKYLETHEGFITDYVNMNKTQPLMLLSQLQVALKPRYRSDPTNAEPNGGEWDNALEEGYAQPNFMLPLYKSGEAPFKLSYGDRLILGRPEIKPSLEYMPGMSGLLERYNGVSSADARIEKADFERFTVAHTALLRFITDLRHFRSVLDTGSSGRVWKNLIPHGIVPVLVQAEPGACLFDAPLNIAAVSADNVANIPETRERVFIPTDPTDPSLQSYPFKCSLDEDLAITESSDQEDTLRNIVATVNSNPEPLNTRKDARIYNILDMNVVPINLHALMREIPLINLINYTYTCDRMVQDALLPETELGATAKGQIIREDFPIKSTRAMLTKMIVYPYTNLSDSEFYGYVSRLATGDSGLDLGRPKFISDQLWNKVLMQELYTQPTPNSGKGLHRADESGPAADSAQRRALRALHENPDKIVAIVNSINEMVIGAFGDNAYGPMLSSDNATTTLGHMITEVNNVLPADAHISRGMARNSRVIATYQGLYPVMAAINNHIGAAATVAARDAAAAGPMAANLINTAIVAAHAAVPTFNNLDAFIGKAQTPLNLMKSLMTLLMYVVIEEQVQNSPDSTARFENNGNLSYPEKNADGVTEIAHADFTDNAANAPGTAIRNDVAVIGRLRFDTTFIRNLFFLTNLQRVMRMIMRDEVSYLDKPVINSSNVINRQVTEYEGNETFDVNVFQN